MKRKWLLSVLLALLLAANIGICANAQARIDYVTDEAGILGETERMEIRDLAGNMSEQYDFGIFVVIVDDYRDYVNGSIETFAEEVFHSYKLGYGESENGIVLAMSMDERDFDIYAHGDMGNYAFTDYGKQQLADSFLDNFRQNDWAGGFRDFVTTSGEMLRQAKNGEPVDIWIPDAPEESGSGFSSLDLAVSVVAGILTGSVAVGTMRSQMKTAVKQTRAEEYISGGVKLQRQRDDFVNRVVSRQAIPKESPSKRSGGHYGGTTIRGSHGGSHHSGKF